MILSLDWILQIRGQDPEVDVAQPHHVRHFHAFNMFFCRPMAHWWVTLETNTNSIDARLDYGQKDCHYCRLDPGDRLNRSLGHCIDYRLCR